jgi:glycosyltransferase involved in cell wall biosynthesis
MTPTVAVAIPAHNEAAYIGACIRSVQESAAIASVPLEIVVALNRCTDSTQAIAQQLGARCVNEDKKCIAAVRNAAVRATSAPYVVTIDADSQAKPGTVAAVVRNLRRGKFIGGGSAITPERLSLGIVCSLAVVVPYVVRRGVSAGMFWFERPTFDAIGGFDETLLSAEDLDFGVRLKRHGRTLGLRYGTIWRDGIVTSCRKFDKFGDWYLVRNPRLVRDLLKGSSRSAADDFYYDVER